MPHYLRTATLFLLWAVGWQAGAADPWSLSHEQSRLGFTATMEGLPFQGIWRRWHSRIELNHAAPGGGSLRAWVDVTSVDSQNTERDQGMGDALWFHFERFPQARFESEDIRALGGDRFEARGRLTIKGITRDIRLPFHWVQNGDSARMRAELTLTRTDFSIGEGEWADADLVGLAVKVSIDARFTR